MTKLRYDRLDNKKRDFKRLEKEKELQNMHIPKRSVKYSQVRLMEKMLANFPLNKWEKSFVESCTNFRNLSRKQREKLNDIYLKYRGK